MADFLINVLFGILGAVVPIGIRSFYHAGSLWTLRVFLFDNSVRWLALAVVLIVIQIIVTFQPEFMRILNTFGVPEWAVSSVVGLVLAGLAVKAIPTVAAIRKGE